MSPFFREEEVHFEIFLKIVGKRDLVVLGQGLRTPVAAQAKSNTKGGGNKTRAKTGIEILLNLFPSFTPSTEGLFIHARKLFTGRECPYNHPVFGEYSLLPWAGSPSGVLAFPRYCRSEGRRQTSPLVALPTDHAGPRQAGAVGRVKMTDSPETEHETKN